jgi:membrane dipeptidase
MDGHVHVTNRVYWEGIDPWIPQPAGFFDYARARRGGANVVIENIAPYGYQNYGGTVKQVGRLIERFHRVAEANRDRMEVALTAADVRRIVAAGKMAVILGVESGFDQEGDIDILRLWYRLGVRLIQFPSQVTSAYGDGTLRGAPTWGGINERGRRLVAEMNRLGMLIDITHATEAAQRQIIDASRAPVVASHIALRAVCNNPANMPDELLRAIAVKGGLVGIHSNAAVISQRYFDYSRSNAVGQALANALVAAPDNDPQLVRGRDPDSAVYIDALDKRLGDMWRQFYAAPWREAPGAEALVPTVDEWADHVTHAIEVAGPTHVGIGLDLTQGRSMLKDFDASSYGQLADVLKKRNVSTQVLGENWLRVMESARVP